MNFREALDSLCEKVGHEDVAHALGVSVQAIRQARLEPKAKAHRTPPEAWERGVIQLAEKRASHYRRLVDKLRSEHKG
jgi:hypothetical protein